MVAANSDHQRAYGTQTCAMGRQCVIQSTVVTAAMLEV